MQPDQPVTPTTIIRSLLEGHPDAEIVLAEACHRRALAVCSEADAKFRFRAARAAHLGYEELRHRIDPRRCRPVNFGIGLASLLALAAALAGLDLIEVSGLPGALAPGPLAAAATVVWLAMGWLGGLAARQQRWAGLSLISTTAALLSLLLMTLYAVTRHPGWLPFVRSADASTLPGILAGALILLLTTAAAVLIAILEPPCLLPARRQWRRAARAYEEAVATNGSDEEADAIATQAWLELALAWAMAACPEEEPLITDTVALAALMVTRGST